MKRGYFGIGVYGSKFGSNIGTLMRHAFLYNADFVFTIGKRYTHEPTDTSNTPRNIPLYHYTGWDDFVFHLPSGCEVVYVEQTTVSQKLSAFEHPERSVYILGAEDKGIPDDIILGKYDFKDAVVEIETPNRISMNVATAGTIIMHDRYMKGLK